VIIKIAKVVTTRGIKGEIKLVSFSNISDLFESLTEVIIADTSYKIEHVKYVKNCVILKLFGIENPEDAETLTAIRRLADLNMGMQEVVLVMKDGETKRPLRMPFKVEISDDLVSQLSDLIGAEKVKVK